MVLARLNARRYSRQELEAVIDALKGYLVSVAHPSRIYLIGSAARNEFTEYSDNVVFLAQQAVEKALKAVLCHSQVPVPLVHDLGALVAKMPADLEPPHGYGLVFLNDYAGILRYELGHGELSDEDISAALGVGNDVVAWARSVVEKARLNNG